MGNYHNLNNCYKCGGANYVQIIATDGSHIAECETVCSKCNFESFWAYGYFNIEPSESEQEEIDKYNLDKSEQRLDSDDINMLDNNLWDIFN